MKDYGKQDRDKINMEKTAERKDLPSHSNAADFGGAGRDYGNRAKMEAGAVEKKTYRHWDSPEKMAKNKAEVPNYDEKMHEVDKAALYTKRSVIEAQRDRINEDNYKRIRSELGSSKTEIYSDANFRSMLPNDERHAHVIGMRDMKDGKIQLRDNDIESLKHTSTHETMHDLSFQNAEHNVDTFRTEKGDTISVSETRQTSGIHVYENKKYIQNGEIKRVEENQLNRYLNEGITEKNTISEMLKRGENPSVESYTQEVNWAINLEEKVGKDLIDDAYYGGNIDQLKDRVDSMSSSGNAWEELNQNIDRYHYELDPVAKIEYKRNVDVILDELHDREKELKKVR